MLIESTEINRAVLMSTLVSAFGIEVEQLTYLTVGNDSYNYRVGDSRGNDWFVSIKRASSAISDQERQRSLEASYRTVAQLRESAGLTFLSTPLRANNGSYLAPIGRLCLAVFPLVEGRTGLAATPAERAQLDACIRELHAATNKIGTQGIEMEQFEPWFELPLTQALARLQTIDASTGPFALWLQQRIGQHRDRLQTMRTRFQVLRTEVIAQGNVGWVITHGEPAWNVIWTQQGPLLVDCGELLLAPPERDLVWLHPTDCRAAERELYGLRWELMEIAEYASHLSQPHTGNGEDIRCRDDLAEYLPA